MSIFTILSVPVKLGPWREQNECKRRMIQAVGRRAFIVYWPVAKRYTATNLLIGCDSPPFKYQFQAVNWFRKWAKESEVKKS